MSISAMHMQQKTSINNYNISRGAVNEKFLYAFLAEFNTAMLAEIGNVEQDL